jgi:hypothetical protein
MRVFGGQLAELPLVATRGAARRQGHARVLVAACEELLAAVGVATVSLPAASSTVRTSRPLLPLHPPAACALFCHVGTTLSAIQVNARCFISVVCTSRLCQRTTGVVQQPCTIRRAAFMAQWHNRAPGRLAKAF